MPGVYGGLIIILAYAGGAIEPEFWLITQDGDPILTDLGQKILVQQEE